MSVLTAAREAVAAALAPTPVHASVPVQVSPPCVLLDPAAPWLQAVTFGTTAVRLDATVVVAAHAGADALTALEALIAEVITRAKAAGFAVGVLDPPMTTTYGQTTALTARVPLTIHMKE